MTLFEAEQHSIFVMKTSHFTCLYPQVEVLMEQERNVLAIDSIKNVDVTELNTTPVKNSIHAMIRTWKYKYASQLHFAAKVPNISFDLVTFCQW